MQMTVKKLIAATAIAGTLGLPAFVIGAGTANAATAAPPPAIPGPADTVQTPGTHVQLVDDDDGGWGWGWGRGDRGWDRGDRGWDRGGWGDRAPWAWGGWGGWGR
jgi:hypothetical protein